MEEQSHFVGLREANQEIERLREMLSIAEGALAKIAAPAIGGKHQQWIAQDTIARLKEKT